jgi:subtilisin family serine protease
VLSIGAIDVHDVVPDFSSSQSFNRAISPLCPAIVAPGVAITSCVPGKKYETMNGTSMATPHVAGLAALLLQARPTATADQLEAAIIGSCARPEAMEEARANHGVPDAVRAYELLTGSQLPAAQVSVAPRRRTPAKKRSARGRSSSHPPRSVAKKMARRPKVAASRRAARKKSPSKRRPA